MKENQIRKLLGELRAYAEEYECVFELSDTFSFFDFRNLDININMSSSGSDIELQLGEGSEGLVFYAQLNSKRFDQDLLHIKKVLELYFAGRILEVMVAKKMLFFFSSTKSTFVYKEAGVVKFLDNDKRFDGSLRSKVSFNPVKRS